MLHQRLRAVAEAQDGAGSAPPTVADAKANFIVDPRYEDKPAMSGSDSASTVAGSSSGAGAGAAAAAAAAAANQPGRNLAPPTMVEVLAKVKAGGWSAGVAGSDRLPSYGEFQQHIAAAAPGGEGGPFFFLGPGRLLAHVRPCDVAGLDASKCDLAVVIDRADNESSYRRLSKLDTQKKAPMLALEGSYETAALLSLAGLNSVLVNQWPTSLSANRRLAVELFAALRAGKDVGQALHITMRRCSMIARSILAAKAEANADDDGGGGGSGGGGGEDDGPGYAYKARCLYNPVVYGLPHVKLQ